MYEMQDITELFHWEKTQNKFLNVSAPMVRYSKLEFRKLLRYNNVKLCFTPMIIADSFSRSQEARLNEFTTNLDDRPLIAQFAARTACEMLAASELVYPYVNGVDLNCGCPQSWATAKGYGCALLRKPDVIKDIIQTLRRNMPNKFSCSVKLRLLQDDMKSTVDLCRQLEHCGATFLIIHGRTQWQKMSCPLDISAMAGIKKSLRIPLVVNGNVKTLGDAEKLYEETEADGIMAARGLLANPALFTGAEQTTFECLQQWLDIANAAGDDLSFQCFHHHLTFMWGKYMRRRERVRFNNFSKKDQVFDFFEEIYDIRPKQVHDWIPKLKCEYDTEIARDRLIQDTLPKQGDWDSNKNGKFFNSYSKRVLDESDEVDLYFQSGSIFDL